MTLINLKLTSIQLNAIELALQNKVEEMTDYYDSDDKHALFHTLDAQIAVEDARIDADGDDGCERSPCPYCIEHSNAQTRSGYAAAVDVGYVLNRLNDIKGDGEFDPDGFFRFIDELEKVVGVHKHD